MSVKKQHSYLNEFGAFVSTLDDRSMQLYIKERLIKQLDFYYKKIGEYKNAYQTLSVFSLILSTAIPIFVLLEDMNSWEWKIVIAVISALVTVISGYLSFMKSKEIWLQYTQSSEAVKSYLFKYFTGADMFKGKSGTEKDDLLTSSCEKIITSEVSSWIQTVKSKEEIKAEAKNPEEVKNA